MRRVLWIIAVFGLGFAAFLYATQPLLPTAPAEAPSPTTFSSATPSVTSRCPKETLEDHGVCVPVPPAPDTEAPDPAVPKLPERPQDLDSYQLPSVGHARLVENTASLPLPAELSGSAGLLIQAPENAVVTHRLDDSGGALIGSPQVIAKSEEQGWLLLAQEQQRGSASLTSLFLYTGLELAAELATLVQGTGGAKPAAEPQMRLGKVRSGELTLAARRLRPGQSPEKGTRSWTAGHSVSTDIRNVLPLIKQ